MSMMAYIRDGSMEVYYPGSGVWVTGRNLPDGAGQLVWEQMLREMRMVRVGEWGTATDGRGKWAAEVAWMAGVAGE